MKLVGRINWSLETYSELGMTFGKLQTYQKRTLPLLTDDNQKQFPTSIPGRERESFP
jgi:hypothetical protein